MAIDPGAAPRLNSEFPPSTGPAIRMGACSTGGLVQSPLPDGTIRTVWLGATPRTGAPIRRCTASTPEPGCGSGRRLAHPRPPGRPRGHASATTTGAGRAGATGRPADDPPGRGRPGPRGREPRLRFPVPGLVPALEQVVTEACADLGCRLFLRASKAYFVEIDKTSHDAFIALGQRFGYPEFLVDDNLKQVAELTQAWPVSRATRTAHGSSCGANARTPAPSSPCSTLTRACATRSSSPTPLRRRLPVSCPNPASSPARKPSSRTMPGVVELLCLCPDRHTLIDVGARVLAHGGLMSPHQGRQPGA